VLENLPDMLGESEDATAAYIQDLQILETGQAAAAWRGLAFGRQGCELQPLAADAQGSVRMNGQSGRTAAHDPGKILRLPGNAEQYGFALTTLAVPVGMAVPEKLLRGGVMLGQLRGLVQRSCIKIDLQPFEDLEQGGDGLGS